MDIEKFYVQLLVKFAHHSHLALDTIFTLTSAQFATYIHLQTSITSMHVSYLMLRNKSPRDLVPYNNNHLFSFRASVG